MKTTTRSVLRLPRIAALAVLGMLAFPLTSDAKPKGKSKGHKYKGVPPGQVHSAQVHAAKARNTLTRAATSDGRTYGAHSYDGRSYDGRSYNGQTYSTRTHDGRSYDGRAYDGRAYDGRAYDGRSYDGRAYDGRSYAGRSYSGRAYDSGYDGGYTSYYSRPRSGFALSFGSGYAGNGYYYGPPGANYYYNRPGVMYYRNRHDVPGSYWGRSSQYSGGGTDAAVQRALYRHGYYRGPIDGDIGPGTRRAIARFEADNGLPVQGYVSRTLLQALDLR